MDREKLLSILEREIENKNIIKHMLATEACMRVLANKLKVKSEKFKVEENFNEEEWAMAGLMHDGDYRPDVPVAQQGVQITETLKKEGIKVPESVAHAMAAHNWRNSGVEPVSPMDWALFCGDSLTGLIVATALVMPSKKLADVTAERVLNRFKEKDFARGTRREDIALCEEKLGVLLPEFVEICLGAMRGIGKELGL